MTTDQQSNVVGNQQRTQVVPKEKLLETKLKNEMKKYKFEPVTDLSNEEGRKFFQEMSTSFEEYLKRKNDLRAVNERRIKSAVKTFVTILSDSEYDLDNSFELNDNEKEYNSPWRRLSFRYFNVLGSSKKNINDNEAKNPLQNLRTL